MTKISSRSSSLHNEIKGNNYGSVLEGALSTLTLVSRRLMAYSTVLDWLTVVRGAEALLRDRFHKSQLQESESIRAISALGAKSTPELHFSGTAMELYALCAACLFVSYSLEWTRWTRAKKVEDRLQSSLNLEIVLMQLKNTCVEDFLSMCVEICAYSLSKDPVLLEVKAKFEEAEVFTKRARALKSSWSREWSLRIGHTNRKRSARFIPRRASRLGYLLWVLIGKRVFTKEEQESEGLQIELQKCLCDILIFGIYITGKEEAADLMLGFSNSFTSVSAASSESHSRAGSVVSENGNWDAEKLTRRASDTLRSMARDDDVFGGLALNSILNDETSCLTAIGNVYSYYGKKRLANPWDVDERWPFAMSRAPGSVFGYPTFEAEADPKASFEVSQWWLAFYQPSNHAEQFSKLFVQTIGRDLKPLETLLQSSLAVLSEDLRRPVDYLFRRTIERLFQSESFPGNATASSTIAESASLQRSMIACCAMVASRVRGSKRDPWSTYPLCLEAFQVPALDFYVCASFFETSWWDQVNTITQTVFPASIRSVISEPRRHALDVAVLCDPDTFRLHVRRESPFRDEGHAGTKAEGAIRSPFLTSTMSPYSMSSIAPRQNVGMTTTAIFAGVGSAGTLVSPTPSLSHPIPPSAQLAYAIGGSTLPTPEKFQQQHHHHHSFTSMFSPHSLAAGIGFDSTNASLTASPFHLYSATKSTPNDDLASLAAVAVAIGEASSAAQQARAPSFGGEFAVSPISHAAPSKLTCSRLMRSYLEAAKSRLLEIVTLLGSKSSIPTIRPRGLAALRHAATIARECLESDALEALRERNLWQIAICSLYASCRSNGLVNVSFQSIVDAFIQLKQSARERALGSIPSFHETVVHVFANDMTGEVENLAAYYNALFRPAVGDRLRRLRIVASEDSPVDFPKNQAMLLNEPQPIDKDRPDILTAVRPNHYLQALVEGESDKRMTLACVVGPAGKRWKGLGSDPCYVQVD